MKRLGNIVRKIFKPVAVLKYLFFPFVIVQSHGIQQITKVPGSKKITMQPTVSSRSFTPEQTVP
jgi:hypothetical protein